MKQIIIKPLFYSNFYSKCCRIVTAPTATLYTGIVGETVIFYFFPATWLFYFPVLSFLFLIESFCYCYLCFLIFLKMYVKKTRSLPYLYVKGREEGKVRLGKTKLPKARIIFSWDHHKARPETIQEQPTLF